MSIALNNPGNLRVSSVAWQGKVVPSSNPHFETFDTPLNGIRAMAKLLRTYFSRGANTIEDIIAEWAPRSENDTDAYIDSVSDDTGFDSDAVIPETVENIRKLVTAIIFHENGEQPYPDDLILTAVKAAF